MRLGNTKGERPSGIVWPQEVPGPQLPLAGPGPDAEAEGLARGSSSSEGGTGLIPGQELRFHMPSGVAKKKKHENCLRRNRKLSSCLTQ